MYACGPGGRQDGRKCNICIQIDIYIDINVRYAYRWIYLYVYTRYRWTTRWTDDEKSAVKRGKRRSVAAT